ncbi:uncharacterized protein [Acropora muricata]
MTKQNNFTLEVIKFGQRHFNLIMEVFRLPSNTWCYSTKNRVNMPKRDRYNSFGFKLLAFTAKSTFKGSIFQVTDIFLQVRCLISVLDQNKKKRH